MDLKKLICGVSAAALALSAMVIPASADYSVIDATGARKWTFATPAPAYQTVAKAIEYYTYSSNLSSSNVDDAKAATGDILGIRLQGANSSGDAKLGAGSISVTYSGHLDVYYTAPSAGILSVKGYSTGNNDCYLQIKGDDDKTQKSENLKKTYTSSNPAKVEYSCAANESMVTTFVKSGTGSAIYGYITEITFTPTYTVTDTGVSDATVTVADGDTSAAVAGNTVTITPDANYEFTNAPTVVDASSNTVAVTENNGSYTFEMPKSNVTVTAAATMITGNRGFTFNIQASEVSGKTLYVKVGTQPEASALIPTDTVFSGEGTVGIAFIISGIPKGMDVSARIE